MNLKSKLVKLCIVTCTLSSCTSLSSNISHIRENYSKKQGDIEKTNTLRSSKITESKTVFTESISCLAKHMANYHNRNYLDKSYFNDYAISFNPNIDNTLIGKEEKNLAEMKQERFNLRLRYNKNEIFYNNRINNKNLTQSQIDKLAKYVVENKELHSQLEKLNSEISNQEAKVLAYKQKLISPTGHATEKQIRDFIQGRVWPKFSVSNIYDKTGKIFSENSTALSEMVAHALSYNNAITYIDTPFNSDISLSRADLSNTKLNTNTNLGSILKADRYINGALIQYDEGTPTVSFLDSLKISLDPISYTNRTKIITIGLVLRMVNKNGELFFQGLNQVQQDSSNSSNGNFNLKFKDFIDYAPASVYVQNTFFVKNIGFNMFEIKNSRNYGGDFSIETSDPKTYAVREMIEMAVYELLLKTLPNNDHNDKQGYRNVSLRAKAEFECKPKFEIK